MADEKLLDELFTITNDLLTQIEELANNNAKDSETNWNLSQRYEEGTKWRPFYHGKSFALESTSADLLSIVTEFRLKRAEALMSSLRHKETVDG